MLSIVRPRNILTTASDVSWILTDVCWCEFRYVRPSTHLSNILKSLSYRYHAYLCRTSTVIVRISGRRVYTAICILAVLPIGVFAGSRGRRGRERERKRARERGGRKGERTKHAFFEAASICGHRLHGPATARRRTNRDGFCVGQLAFVLVRFSEAKRHVRLTANTEGRPTTWCSRLSYFWRWFSFCQDDGWSRRFSGPFPPLRYLETSLGWNALLFKY